MAAPSSYARRSFVGNAAATSVALGLGASDGSCALASATNWPSGSTGDFLVVIDRGNLNFEELAWCSGVSGTTLTFAQRGAQGTSGIAHNPGCTIALSMGTQDLDEANQVVNQVLGQSGAAKGDILAMLSAAGPNTLTRIGIGTSTQVLGVSAGLPAWETPTNGYGITGFAANPMTPAVALSTASGSISSPVSISGTTKAFDTASLSVGSWNVTMNAVLENTTAGPIAMGVQALVDSATATLTGVTAAEGAITAATNGQIPFALAFIAVVTVAGTLKLNAVSSSASGNVLATSVAAGFTGITGYTATRFA